MKDDINEILIFYDKIHTTINPANYLEWNTFRVFKNLGSHVTLQPNFNMDENGYPLGNAAPGLEDILIEYKDFSVLIECSLRSGVGQIDFEASSVVRHIKNYKERELERDSYCLFLAPSVEIDFAKYISFDKREAPVIPLTITQFKRLVISLKSEKTSYPSNFKSILEKLLRIDLDFDKSEDWLNFIDASI